MERVFVGNLCCWPYLHKVETVAEPAIFCICIKLSLSVRYYKVMHVNHTQAYPTIPLASNVNTCKIFNQQAFVKNGWKF